MFAFVGFLCGLPISDLTYSPSRFVPSEHADRSLPSFMRPMAPPYVHELDTRALLEGHVLSISWMRSDACFYSCE